MTVLLEAPETTKVRDPRAILDEIGEANPHLIPDPGVGLWEREVRLLMRDIVRVRSLAERILGQGVAYLITATHLRTSSIVMPPTIVAAADEVHAEG